MSPGHTHVTSVTKQALDVNGTVPYPGMKTNSEGLSPQPDGGSPAGLPHVLAVDDDVSIRQLISVYLSDFDLRVTAVASGREMLQVIEHGPVDVVLLDLRLPGEDGLQLARALRERSKVPIIILTGRKDEADRVMGLELGADDYVTKPFSPRELLARIRAVLRRQRMHETVADTMAGVRAYRFAGWELNVRLRRLTAPGGEEVPLRNGECNLLLAFLAAPQRVLGRDQLIGLSRLHTDEVYDRTIDVQVGRLRKKIEVDPRAPRFILTERGVGYLFDSPVEVVHG